jgi:DNA/RNA endonuclease YhcR with UshA esterase domain
MKKYYIALAFLFSSILGFSQVRIFSVDPVNNRFTLKNFGTSTVNVSSNRICTEFVYPTISSLTIVNGSASLAAGATVTFSGLNIDPAGGGADFCLYTPTGSFSMAANMLDFMQFGSGGNGRESVAVAKGIWTAGQFITGPGQYNYGGGANNNGLSFWSSVAVDCADLFISEYIEGSSNNKAFEIFNPTNSSVNLSNYVIYEVGNGGSFTNTFNPDGILPSKQVYVISTDQADSVILNIADTSLSFPSVAHFNGDDALILVNSLSGDTIDVFGVPGVDPGSEWPVTGINGVIGSTKDNTLVRGPNINVGDTTWTVVQNQWYVYPQNTFSHLGFHNALACGSSIPAYMISDVKGYDANRVPDSVGVQCQLTGIIHNPDQGFSDVEFAFQDGSAGIWLEGNPLPTYTPLAEGDLITVWGTINHGSGVTEIIPDSMVLVSAGNPLFLAEKMDTLNEYTEGRYVRLDSVKFLGINPGDTFGISGSGDNFSILTQQTDTFTLRIDRNYELDWNGNLIPTGLFNVVGVGSQFDFSSPFDAGYQIFPSRFSDLEILSVAGEAISFGGPSDMVSENAGSYLVLVTIADTLASTSTVDVNRTGGTATPGTDFTFNDTTLTFSAGAMDSFWLEVTIIDNLLPNPDKTVILSLQNLTGSAFYGVDTVFTLTILNDDIPTYTIATIRGNDTDGIADSIGVYCKATGVVLGVDLQGSSSNAFSFDDGTGGISLFKGGGFTPPYTVTEGDSVRVIGVISHFNGLSQFNPDSMMVIATGANVPTPMVVTALGESTESRYIRINNVILVDPNEWQTGGSFTARVHNATDTFDVRVDSDVNVSNMLPPVGAFDVIGVGGQFFSAGPPYNGGYQILPMDTSQIIPYFPPTPSIPTYNIGEVIGLDTDFVPDSLGILCKLVGVTYGENFRMPGGLSFTLIDPNNNDDGIQVFSSSQNFGYTVNEGDEIRVIGTIDFFSGLTEILPDSIVVISSGNTLKNPVVVSTLDEFSESNLVVREGTYLSEGIWGTGTSGFNVRFVDLLINTDTFEVRIDNDADLFTAPEPTDGSPYNIVGIGGQFDFSSPYDQGYQLLPRRATDLTLITGLAGNLKGNEVRIYPVPSNGLLHIETATQGIRIVTVMDILGNVKYEVILQEGDSKLNLEFLAEGTYLIKIQERSSIITRKFTMVK